VDDLILVAASGLARETAHAAHASGRFRVTGMVDDDPARWGSTVGGFPVLGGLDVVTDDPGPRLVVCAGRGADREQVVSRLQALGVPDERYATVVHPSVDLPPTCSVGAGSILLAHVALTADVSVGAHVVVMPNATLTHDDAVADYATICAGVSLAGGVDIGAAAYVGANASVREGVSIGIGATVGMGAAVLSDVPEGKVWAGVPAVPFKRAAVGTPQTHPE